VLAAARPAALAGMAAGLVRVHSTPVRWLGSGGPSAGRSSSHRARGSAHQPV